MRRNRHTPNVDRSTGDYVDPARLREIAAGYREMADWLETTEFPIPRTALYGDLVGVTIWSSWIPDEGFVKRVGSAIRLLGGRVEKVANGASFELQKKFSGGVTFRYSMSRDAICEPVEVEREVYLNVPVDVDEAERLKDEIREAKERLEALDTKFVKVREQAIDYVCPKALLPDESPDEAQKGGDVR